MSGLKVIGGQLLGNMASDSFCHNGNLEGARKATFPRPMRKVVVEFFAWISLAALAWGFSSRFDAGYEVYRWGAASWPRAVIALIVIAAIIHLVREWRMMPAGETAPAEKTTPVEGATVRADHMLRLRTLGIIFLPILYVTAVPRIGYFVTTPFFLITYMYIFGQRRSVHLFGTSLLIYASILLIFSGLLYIPLPVGYWPGFYEFGHTLTGWIRTLVHGW